MSSLFNNSLLGTTYTKNGVSKITVCMLLYAVLNEGVNQIERCHSNLAHECSWHISWDNVLIFFVLRAFLIWKPLKNTKTRFLANSVLKILRHFLSKVDFIIMTTTFRRAHLSRNCLMKMMVIFFLVFPYIGNVVVPPTSYLYPSLIYFHNISTQNIATST